MNIKCFCDASFDPRRKIAVIGWKIGTNSNTQYDIIEDTTNTAAEICVLIRLIEELINDHDHIHKYTIFTDCQSIINRINSAQKLIDCQFKNRRGKLLTNAHLYCKLFDLLNPRIKIKHTAGHMPKLHMNNDQLIFSELDIAVRKRLRTLINEYS